MYRQILLDDSQRQYTHIFFREDPALPLDEYELQTVTYGLTPSSFLAHRVLIQLTRDEGQPYPLATAAILQDSVVDDLLVGADSLSELLEIKNQLTSLLEKGCFPLNKWMSNSPEFLSVLRNSEPSSSLVIKNMDDHAMKVLGIGWDPNSDTFLFFIDPPVIQNNYTKRQVLSTIARIYDPLGFTAPMIFMFKCTLKDIWLSGVNWDEPIPPSLNEIWLQCIAELPNLHALRIPRCIFISKPLSCCLLGFCDGSLKGSAAVLYLRVQFPDSNVKIFLLKSKTKVAPSKIQTVPRLELIGALLLSKLIKSVKPFLNRLPEPNYSTFLFCDSTIVLSWLRKPPHLLKLFIANRISAILDHTLVTQWHHIPTEYNVSDCASRGLSPNALLAFKPWFEGPPWAYDPPDSWPTSPFNPNWLDNLPEVKSTILLNLPVKTEPPPSFPLRDFLNNYSTLTKIQRITAYILRFSYNAKHASNKKIGPLSAQELSVALNTCIKCDQIYYFSKDLISLSSGSPCTRKVQSLSPFIDSFGLIRVGGRLKNSELSFSTKHPILLSNSSPLTRLLIKYFHESYLHSGPRTLEALISRRFWIINCRSVVRSVIFNCNRCARFRSTTVSPPMGDLPSTRVVASRPFLNCSVDLAGPYTLKESSRRNARTFKGYFSLFICFAVKAVHIEILTSLSSECFIAALHRFVSRRGLPSSIYCDQATNFKGASRQLSEIITFLKSANTNDIFKEHLASLGINFKFNVPRAPNMAGLVESNIKNVKYHLIRAIGHQVLTFEEFSTITARVEAILNSRPLGPLSTSPDEFQPLTPGHFLVGGPLLSVADEDLNEVPSNRLSRWQLISQITQSLWRRWEHEYLHTLQNKSKWFSPDTNICEGQLVWLIEDGTHPLYYPLGRIAQVHPGKDGVVRAATVRTAAGTYRRPVRKLAPLPNA